MTLGIALVGYGKMGHLSEQLAPQYDCCVKAKFNSRNNAGGSGLTRTGLAEVDVAIEFSTQRVASCNLVRLEGTRVTLVLGRVRPAARKAVQEVNGKRDWTETGIAGDPF